MKKIALWLIGRQIEKSVDFLKWVSTTNPDYGVRQWAKGRSDSYRHILAWLRGEDELETRKNIERNDYEKN
jgi:hypothetical protein